MRRKKRTNSEVEEDINKVALSLIEEKGFGGVTLTGITKLANIEASVFYNRFDTLDDYLDKFVEKYDYWFGNILSQYEEELYSRDGYLFILQALLSSLSENKIMQQLLRWEVTDKNATTIRTAKLREFHTLPLTKKFQELFKGTTIDIGAISSLIVGGIYYLTLHRDLCAFCEIDIKSQAGKERIINAIDCLTKELFSKISPDNEKLEIARKLKAKNVECMIIAECMELPLAIVEKL